MWEMYLGISRRHLDELRKFATTSGHCECCGLLFGSDSEITGVQICENVAKNTDMNFEIAPAELIAAERQSREGEAKLIGYFHSHPNGNIFPSANDAEMAHPDGRFWLIITSSKVTAWRAVANGSHLSRFDRVELDTMG
jgi:desampylase